MPNSETFAEKESARIAQRKAEIDKRVVDRGTGGATSYYDTPPGNVTLNDLVEYKRMNYATGEAFVSIYRMNDTGDKKRNLKKAIYYLVREWMADGHTVKELLQGLFNKDQDT